MGVFIAQHALVSTRRHQKALLTIGSLRGRDKATLLHKSRYLTGVVKELHCTLLLNR